MTTRVCRDSRELYRRKSLNVPIFPERRASASLGLFCFKRANCSGCDNNISLIALGSSSALGRDEPGEEAVPGTWIELKSRLGSAPATEYITELLLMHVN